MTAVLAPIEIVSIIDTPQKAYWLDTDLMEILVTREQSGGRYDVIRTTVQPGGGPPPHRHAREDELFYVIDGEFEFIRNDEIFTAGPGTSVFLPRGSVHTFKNVGDTAGRLFVVATPSGFAEFVADGGSRPPIALSSPSPRPARS